MKTVDSVKIVHAYISIFVQRQAQVVMTLHIPDRLPGEPMVRWIDWSGILQRAGAWPSIWIESEHWRFYSHRRKHHYYREMELMPF
jgi:hypothetical protein